MSRWDAARARKRGANLVAKEPPAATVTVRCKTCGVSARVPVVDTGEAWLESHTARHHSQEALF